jgi:translocation and assembly module TamB
MKIILKALSSILAAFVITLIMAIGWLKTDNAKTTIQTTLMDLVQEKSGLEIEIRNIDFSLPLVIEAEYLSVKDNEGEIGNLKNLYINILPSLLSYWEINIWSVGAEELNILKTTANLKTTPKTNDKANSAGSFNPNIIVRNINIDSINILPQSSDNGKHLAVKFSSGLEYNSTKQKLSFHTLNKLLPADKNSLLQNASLKISGYYDITQKQLALKTADFKLGIADINGNLFLDQNKDIIAGEVQYQSSIIDKILESSQPVIKSDIKGKISINGTAKNPLISAKGAISIDLPENDYFRFLPLDYETNLILVGQDLAGTVTISQDNIITNGDIEYKEGKIFLREFVTNGDNFKNNMNLAVDLKTMLVDGNISLAATSLTEDSGYFPFIYGGAINMEVICSSGEGKAQQLSLTANAGNLVSKFGKLNDLKINFHSPDLKSAKIDSLDLLFDSLAFNNTKLEKLKITTGSHNDGFLINTNINLSQPHEIDLGINSFIKLLDQKSIDLTITKASGYVGKAPVKNLSNISLTYGDNFRILTGTIQIGAGNLKFEGNTKDSSIFAKAAMTNIPGNTFNGLLPTNFQHSIINGTIDLIGTKQNPGIKTDINISEITISNLQKKFGMIINSAINHDQSELTIKAIQAQKNLANFSASVKNKFSLSPFNFEINQEKDLKSDLNITDKLDLFSLIPGIPGHKIKGEVTGHMHATGTIKKPHFTGNLKLSNGKYVVKNYGIKLANISGAVKAEDNLITLTQLTAKDNEGNFLKSRGEIDILNNYQFNITANASKFNPINHPFLSGKVSADITINGNLSEALASGKIDLGPMEIKIPEYFNQNIPELNIIEVAEEKEHIKNKKEIPPYKLNLNIELATGDKTFVRGRGVDTKVEGKMKAQGNNYAPIIMGTLKSVRGQYKEFGKTLRIKEGVLTFDGSITPFLKIVGAHNVSDAEIRLVLSGLINDPQFTIESTPDMPRDEALSLLLFGNKTDNISPLQAVQLAESAQRLSGHGNKSSFDPLGMGRKILGVDDINLKTNDSDSGNNSIEIGKYFTDKIYIKGEAGGNRSQLGVEIQITPRISIENITTKEGNNYFGINWKFDY